MSFRFLDHTADLRMAVEGESLAALFADAIRGFTTALVDLEVLGEATRWELEVAAARLPDLLHDTLEELLFHFEVDGWLAARAQVEIAESEEGFRLHAILRGEHYEPGRHPLKLLLKGVTYHGLTVEPLGHGWRAEVIFDL